MTDNIRIELGADNPGYTVQKIHGCRIVFGNFPLEDMSMLCHGFSENALLATDIADRIGATFVGGEPEDLEVLRSMNLPVSEKRRNEHDRAMAKGLQLVAEWLRDGERGASSNAMCCRIFGYFDSLATPNKSHPSDPSDLLRCVKFVEATQCEHRIGLMTDVSPQWARLVANWDELCAILKREMADSKSAPETYALMQKVLAE